jgi:hypothetical protein
MENIGKNSLFFTGIKPCIKPTVEYFYSYYDDTLLNLINSKCPRKLTDKEQKIYFKKLKDIYIIIINIKKNVITHYNILKIYWYFVYLNL